MVNLNPDKIPKANRKLCKSVVFDGHRGIDFIKDFFRGKHQVSRLPRRSKRLREMSTGCTLDRVRELTEVSLSVLKKKSRTKEHVSLPPRRSKRLREKSKG